MLEKPACGKLAEAQLKPGRPPRKKMEGGDWTRTPGFPANLALPISPYGWRSPGEHPGRHRRIPPRPREIRSHPRMKVDSLVQKNSEGITPVVPSKPSTPASRRATARSSFLSALDQRHAHSRSAARLRRPVLSLRDGLPDVYQRDASADRGYRGAADAAREPHRGRARRREPSRALAPLLRVLGLDREDVKAGLANYATRTLIATMKSLARDGALHEGLRAVRVRVIAVEPATSGVTGRRSQVHCSES